MAIISAWACLLGEKKAFLPDPSRYRSELFATCLNEGERRTCILKKKDEKKSHIPITGRDGRSGEFFGARPSRTPKAQKTNDAMQVDAVCFTSKSKVLTVPVPAPVPDPAAADAAADAAAAASAALLPLVAGIMRNIALGLSKFRAARMHFCRACSAVYR